MSGAALRWWQYAGPWPLRPVAAALLSALFFTAFTSGQRFGAGEVVSARATASVLAGSVASGLLIGMALWLWSKASAFVTRGWGYALAIASTSIVVAIVRVTLGWFPADSFPTQFGAFAYATLRIVVLLLVVMATVGFAARRLRFQADATSDALELARHHQRLLLEADESTRRQVAALLHDRVQAGLIAGCLQLQAMAATATPSDREDLHALIDRLEQLRALDVRGAARALSPDLSDVDLQTALEDLAAQYEPGMVCDIDVDEVLVEHGAPVDPQALLASYRIAEQAMLNSAIHGRAAVCTIRVRLDQGWLLLDVSDNGRGPDDQAGQPGLGSALIDTWTGILGGEWSLTGGASGAVLHARLPAHA